MLAAARELLADGGAQALSMRALASRLAVAPNALYSHVENKTALLDALLDDPRRRAELAAAARTAVQVFDWPSVALRVLEVYATAIEATDGRVMDEEWAEPRSGA